MWFFSYVLSVRIVHRGKKKRKGRVESDVCLLQNTPQSSHLHLFPTQSIQKLGKAHPSSAECFREESRESSKAIPLPTQGDWTEKKKEENKRITPIVPSPSLLPAQGPDHQRAVGTARGSGLQHRCGSAT